MKIQTRPEQRRFPRTTIEKPCKVFHPASARYLQARTLNVSDAGAMLEILWPCKLKAGEALDAYLPPDGVVIVNESHRIGARVVRVLSTASTCVAAIKFAKPQPQFAVRVAKAAA